MATIFDTTANTEFNAFSDPFNPANMNPGQWGVNPNYLTPSYSAPYRPGYNGPQGGPSSGSQPGFYNSVNQLTNPFAPTPMYGNPYRNNMAYTEQIHSRPVDAAMWASQRIVVPATSLYLSYKMGNIMTARMNTMGGAMAAGASRFFGGSEAEVAAARATQGIFGAVGDRFAQGTVRGMFGTARAFSHAGVLGEGLGAAAFRTAAAEGAGIIGGVAGSLLLPAVLGMAAASAFSRVAVDPYVAFSRTGSDLRRNFAGVNVAGGGGGGNVLSGQGMSFASSYKAAGEITHAGIHDFTFNEGQFSQISDFSARAGLLDDATIGQISKRVKNIANQVKMVMRIANEPDIKAAIEMLSNLNSAGASVTSGEAGRALGRIGGNAAIAGISTQRMMNTVGMQGQYLFQANGMVPYMGQIAASNNMATFASAYRQGVISPTLMATLGGPEGASQSSLTAQINGSQTMYNRIVMANRYMGGFSGNGVTNNLNAFGANFSKNPIGSYGEMMMNSGLMSSRQFSERGELGLQDQIMDVAKNIPGMVKKNGRIDASNAYTLMTGQMGLSHDQAFAYIQQMTAAQDPRTQMQMLSGNNANTINQMTQLAVQQGLAYGANLTPAVRGIRKFGQSLISGMSAPGIAAKEAIGGGMDSLMDMLYGFQFGHETGGGGDFSNIKNMKDANAKKSLSIKTLMGVPVIPSTSEMMKSGVGSPFSMMAGQERAQYDASSYLEKLDKGLSNIDSSPLTASRKIQAATILAQKGENLDTTDPETQKLMAILGIHPDADKTITSSIAGGIVKQAAKGHILGYGSVTGVKSREDIMSDVAKNPSKYLKGDFLNDYKKAGSDKEREMAILVGGRSESGSKLFDQIPEGVVSAGTAKEIVDQLSVEQEGTKRNRTIMNLAKEGRIDASQFTMALAANNMLEASLNMKEAAGILAGKPVGASADSNSPVSGAGMFDGSSSEGAAAFNGTRKFFSSGSDKGRKP